MMEPVREVRSSKLLVEATGGTLLAREVVLRVNQLLGQNRRPQILEDRGHACSVQPVLRGDRYSIVSWLY